MPGAGEEPMSDLHDRRKQSLYFPEDMLREIMRVEGVGHVTPLAESYAAMKSGSRTSPMPTGT